MTVRANLRWAILLAGMGGLGGWAFTACGSNAANDFTPDDDAGTADDAPTLGTFLDAQSANTLSIAPQNATLDVTAPGATQQFHAFLNGSTTSSPAIWQVDVAAMGTIDQTGLFKATGALGGLVRISAAVGNATASTNLNVRLHIVENPGNVDPATQAKLKAGGTADSTFKWLYPYDQTVFPRGLRPPTLQLAGSPGDGGVAGADATFVHITAGNLDYQGFYGASAPIRVDFSDATWSTITQTAGSKDPVKVEVTKISGGAVTGPAAETIFIAQGSLKGTVYYNTYSSPQAGNSGAVMRVKPNAATAEVLIGSPSRQENCTVCHAVSANGSVLVASHADYQTGASWDLTANVPDGGATPVLHEQTNTTYSFGALYPDGAFLMSNAALAGGWPPNVPGQELGQGEMQRASRLYDTKTGAMIPAPGWDNVITMAITPTFAQNGKRLGFNHYDKDQGHTLSVMDFDPATKSFSNLVDLITTDMATYPAWPAFTPDGDWVIFHTGSRSDYATWNGAKADLSIAHIPSKTVVKLDALNGYKNGVAYLPYGEAEAHLNYEPTILPVAVGGYYWAVFTSRRKYGNTIVDDDPGGSPEDAQDRKKLWISAIDIESTENPHTMAYDKSHPAFYLTGQELTAGNMRGFWALDPCKQNGNTCETGDECCGGFCRQQTEADGGSQLVCVPAPTGCANEFEKCVTTADCCGAAQGYQCLNGHCAKPAPN